MGGNAINSVRRWAAKEYKEHVAKLYMDLRAVLGDVRFQETQHHHNKESFGDCDLVVESDSLSSSWVGGLVEYFALSKDQWKKNGNVLSFDYHGLQVDLIVTPTKYYRTALDYFSWDDLHNLVGRISHKLGLKFGHRGTEIVVREQVDYGSHILGSIQLSDNIADIYDILGLDICKLTEGFRNLDDIFNFVVSSKYFDPDIYLLDNRAHYSRTRDRKRKTYHEFLLWIERTKPEKKFDFPDKTEHGGYSIREPYYTDIILNRWPWVKEKVDALVEENEFDKKFKLVYNGNIIGELTGKSGKELGGIMSKLKEKLTKEIKEQMIADPELVKLFVTEAEA